MTTAAISSVVIILALASSQVEAIPQDNVNVAGATARRFEVIVARHRQEADALHRNHPARARAISFFRRRKADFAQLIDDARSSRITHLNRDDLLALVKCGEQTRDYKTTLGFARAAMTIDPENDAVRFAFTRALLNAGEMNEAEALVTEWTQNTQPHAEIRAAYGLLYAKRRIRKDYSTAAAHLERFIEFFIEKLAVRDTPAYGIEVYLSRLQHTMDAAQSSDRFALVLSEYDRTLDLLFAKIQESNAPTKFQVMRSSSILSARFEIARSISQPDAVEHFANWAEFVLAAVNASPEGRDGHAIEVAALAHTFSKYEFLQSKREVIVEQVKLRSKHALKPENVDGRPAILLDDVLARKVEEPRAK